jgi:hypothetical protein
MPDYSYFYPDSDSESDYDDDVEELLHYPYFSRICSGDYKIYNRKWMLELPYKIGKCYKIAGLPYIIKVIEMDVSLRRPREQFSTPSYSLYKIIVKLFNEETRTLEQKTIIIEAPIEHTAAIQATIPIADVHQTIYGSDNIRVVHGTTTRRTPRASHSIWDPETQYAEIDSVGQVIEPLEDNDELLTIKISNGGPDITEVNCPKELKGFVENYCSISGGKRRKSKKSKMSKKSKNYRKTRKIKKSMKSKKFRK